MEIILPKENAPVIKKKTSVYLVFQERIVHMVLWRVVGNKAILYNSGRPHSVTKNGRLYNAPLDRDDHIEELKSRGFEVD